MSTIGAESNWQEWNYETTSGNDLLVVRTEYSCTWVSCDTGNYTIILRFEAYLTDEQAKLEPLHINYVDYILLADGTKLMVLEN